MEILSLRFAHCTHSREIRGDRYSRGWSQAAGIPRSDNFSVENAKHRQINAWSHTHRIHTRKEGEKVIESTGKVRARERQRRSVR